MASKEEVPQAAGVSAPGQPDVREEQLKRPVISENCEDPAPEAPFGKGMEAITTDEVSGEKIDKVYGFRPKSTWHLKPRKEMNMWEFITSLDLGADTVYQRKPNEQRDKPPHHSVLLENAFLATSALIPLSAHAGWNYLVPSHEVVALYAWPLYHIWFIIYSFTMLKRLHYYMGKYGCLDEHNRGRDLVDDKHVNHLGRAILLYTIVRTVGVFLFSWRADELSNPLLGLSWKTPLKLGVWQVCFDLFFYLYHRSCHEFDCLWFIHRQHHATKHPSPALAILADDIQETIEIFICPFLATMVAPKMSFAELYYTAIVTIYVETLGHSGIRADWPHPILGLVLRPFKMELAVEDHDLHHRFGKSGRNYGKQTRVWDTIFSTKTYRIETEN